MSGEVRQSLSSASDEAANQILSEAPVFVIAASGTGGHLFPAIYIARALKDALPGCVVEFIGSGRPLEEKVIDGAGYKRHVVGVSGVKQSGIAGVFRFLMCVPSAWSQVRTILKSRNTRAVVGVGGYVSVIPILVAKFMGKTTWIHEAELHPGMANWFLSLFAKKISLAFEDAKVPFWAAPEYTGHPVRPEISAVDTKTIPDDAPKRILVLGGSQGARALDVALPKVLAGLGKCDVQICHQARPENVESVSAAYQEAKIQARAVPFIEDMAAAYAWSDVVVSRSGAGSIMEIATVNRPAILVPYPHQQGTHQSDNAKTLSNRGKAYLVEEGDLFEQRLGGAMGKLLTRDSFRTMKEAASDSRNVDAANRIAKRIVELSE